MNFLLLNDTQVDGAVLNLGRHGMWHGVDQTGLRAKSATLKIGAFDSVFARSIDRGHPFRVNSP